MKQNTFFDTEFLYPAGFFLVVTVVLVFASGYYLGRADGIEEFVVALRQEKFSHAIESAVATGYQASNGEEIGEEIAESESLGEESEIDGEAGSESDSESEEARARSDLTFVARLAGFGARISAERYVAQLKAKGITAEVLSRGSGRKSWYQVVTTPRSYEETLAVVEKLKKEDRLGAVEIVASQKAE